MMPISILLPFFSFFGGGGETGFFCVGTNDTTILDSWQFLPRVSKPGWIHSLACFVTCMQRISQVHLLSAIPADLLADSIMADPFPHLLPSFLGGGNNRFPLGLENLEKWEGIFQSGKSQGILNRLEKSGKNHTKHWKTQGILNKYYLIFLMIFKWTVYYLLKWIKFSV